MNLLRKYSTLAFLVLSVFFQSGCTGTMDYISNGPQIIKPGPENSKAVAGEEDASAVDRIEVFLCFNDWYSGEYVEKYYTSDLKTVFSNADIVFTGEDQRNYGARLVLMNSTDQLPDVFRISQDIAYTIIKSNGLQDLTDYLKADGFFEKYNDSNAIIPYIDGKIYAANCGDKYYHCPVILYWKDIFDSLNIPSVPQNYNDFFTFLQEILNKDIIPLTGEPYLLEAILFQQLIIAEDPSFAYSLSIGKTGVTGEPFLRAAHKLQDLLCSGLVDNNIKYGNSGKAFFDEKKAAMYLTYTWNLSKFDTVTGDNSSNFAIMPFPSANAHSQPLPAIQFWGDALDGYAVSNKSRNIPLSAKVLEYLVEKDAYAFTEIKKESLPFGKAPEINESRLITEYRLNAFKASALKIPTLVTIMKPQVYSRWKSELGLLWDPASQPEDFVERMKLIWDSNFTTD